MDVMLMAWQWFDRSQKMRKRNDSSNEFRVVIGLVCNKT